mgnify:CR=1 FL=1
MSGLRDRIAAALRAHDYWDGCTDRRCVLAPDCEGCLHRSNEMADAVLAALGLTEERRPGATTTLNNSVWTRPDKRRYITDWEEDEQ